MVKKSRLKENDNNREITDKTLPNNKTQRLNREIRKIKEESISSYLQNLTDDKDTNKKLNCLKNIWQLYLHQTKIGRNNKYIYRKYSSCYPKRSRR